MAGIESYKEGYTESINEFAGSTLDINKEMSATGFEDMAKDYLLFTPVLFYRCFPRTEKEDSLASIIGDKFTLIRTNIFDKPFTISGNNLVEDDCRLYGVVKEQAPAFINNIARAICKNTPSHLACAIDVNDVRVPNFKNSGIIIKYFRIIGNHYTFRFPNNVLEIGPCNPPVVEAIETPKDIAKNFETLFNDPATLFDDKEKT